MMIRAFPRDAQRWHLYRVSVLFVAAHLIAVFVIRMFNPSRYYGCTALLTIYAVRHLPYYFAVCRSTRGLPLHAAQIAVFISRWSGAQLRIIRFDSAIASAVILHFHLSTRREISGEMDKHSEPPPNIRRRRMHSIQGAFV